MRSELRPSSIGAETTPDATALSGSATPAHGFWFAALAALLLLAVLASVHLTRPPAAGADIQVLADGNVPVVLCVVDTGAQARCFARDRVLSGTLDGTIPAICGRADRPIESPCPGGGECSFPYSLTAADAFGIVLLEPRPPLFGVPRHRLIDAAVIAPGHGAADAADLTQRVQSLARCFAPSATPVETEVSRHACENGACRLPHSSLRVTLKRAALASDR